MKSRLRVLHTPANVGGNPFSLSRAERKLGIESFCLTLSNTIYNYRTDLCVYSSNRLVFLTKIFYWGLWKTKDFHVIHYNFGESLFPMKPEILKGNSFKKVLKTLYYNILEFGDVKIAKLQNKVIAVTYQGDDARQGDYCKSRYTTHFVHEVEEGYYSPGSDELKRNRIQKFAKYADLIYSLNPDLLHVLPSNAKFLPYACINIEEWSFVGTQKGTDFIPHIVHAPSHRKVKGSDYIIEAVKKLKSEGHNFNFTLVEGYEHAEAKKIYKNADLLVDQLLAGFYGGLSVELMSLGKPVICYLREEDLTYLPSDMLKDLPIINSGPEDIYTTLKFWITHKNELYERGIKSRKYVEKWHDPKKIAKILKNDYELMMEAKNL